MGNNKNNDRGNSGKGAGEQHNYTDFCECYQIIGEKKKIKREICDDPNCNGKHHKHKNKLTKRY